MENKRELPHKLHLECGLVTPSGWVNVDASWNAWLAKHSGLRKILSRFGIVPKHLAEIPWNPNIMVHDVRKGLPFPNNYFSAIYASHLLEHLYLLEAQYLLRECFRCLQAGGVLRIVVPDLRAIVTEYLGEEPFGRTPSGLANLRPADRMMKRLSLRKPESPRGNLGYWLYTALKDFHSHKWMYDTDSLIGHFQEAGFEHVRACKFLESRIEGIEKVEKPERFLNNEGICVEGIKGVEYETAFPRV